jgi:hypothetical protein
MMKPVIRIEEKRMSDKNECIILEPTPVSIVNKVKTYESGAKHDTAIYKTKGIQSQWEIYGEGSG